MSIEILTSFRCYSTLVYQDHALVCGANSSEVSVAKGVNEHCRLYKVEDDKYVLDLLLSTDTRKSRSVLITHSLEQADSGSEEADLTYG